MKWTGLNELREKYLSFFESKDHLRLPSFSLVPNNDKSLLLINSGMAPMKKFFTGEVEPPRRRVTTCQKCIRTPDLERVGKTARHGTYFEMLGNFSFGDYFKREAIAWSWEFLTKTLEIPGELLWPSIYEKDEESYDIWVNEIGVNPAHVVRLGKADNFWEHGSGPCGPCSEIYFDRGEKYGCGSPDCKPGCDCDRYMEIWNNVFSQFSNDGNGNYTELMQKNIDTGMGLERLACVMQGVDNLFEVDTVRSILDTVCKIADKTYGNGGDTDVSIRVVTDHIRSATFMISDGVIPSNEGRGYVLRRILRRAARHGKLLGINRPFLTELCEVVIEQNKDGYPELVEKHDYIIKVIAMEEERFDATIDAGLSILSNLIRRALTDGVDTISGDEVFKLYDTFGFPIDLTREIASEQNLKIDEETFAKLMNDQKTRARSARANISGWSDSSKAFLADLAKTEFTGYGNTVTDGAKVLAIIVDDTPVDIASEGDFTLILDKTPFYGEGGGQVGDTGVIYDADTAISVTDTKKSDGVYIHLCSIASGDIKVGDVVRAEVDAARRAAIMRNHSAAHLLQAALRQVVGSHVEQAGSYVDATRCRFDFTHFAALTNEEIAKVEGLVNAHILLGEEIVTKETDINTARAEGAMALFGEKYGDVVRMVKMGTFSTELCGGTHLDNTSKCGLFKIIAESSVAAGVRRIEAITGLEVLKYMADKETLIAKAAGELKTNPAEIVSRAAQLQGELKSAKHEIEALNAKIAAAGTADIMNNAVKVGELTVVAAVTEGMNPDAARGVIDDLKAKDDTVVALLATVVDGKANLVCGCGKAAVAKGALAGKIVGAAAAVTGGKGGGRPDSAMAGVGDVSKLSEAVAAVPSIVEGMIK